MMSYLSRQLVSSLSCVVVLLLAPTVYCISEQHYCYGEHCSDLEVTDEPDEFTALQSPPEKGTSLVSRFTGAVGSFFRPVYSTLYSTAARTVDFATKVAYKVWVVLIDEVHDAIKDYIPAILTVSLFIFCLLLSFIFWKCNIPLYYLLLFNCGIYVLYTAIGPEALFAVLMTAGRYFSWSIATIMMHRVYRFMTAVVVVVIFVLLYCVLPCLHMSARVDELHTIQLQLADLAQRLSHIENSQAAMIQNQNTILRVLPRNDIPNGNTDVKLTPT